MASSQSDRRVLVCDYLYGIASWPMIGVGTYPLRYGVAGCEVRLQTLAMGLAVGMYLTGVKWGEGKRCTRVVQEQRADLADFDPREK